MAEKYRVQAKADGEWKTRKLFYADEDYSLACTHADEIFETGDFDEVRILEAKADVASGKISYTLKYTLKHETDFLSPVDPDSDGGKPSEQYPLLIQKGITGEWVVLEKKNASNHPLFGVKGWLAYAMYILALGPFVEMIFLHKEGELFDFSSIVLMGVTFIYYWFPLFLLRKRHPKFQFVIVLFQLFYLCWVSLIILLSFSIAPENLEFLPELALPVFWRILFLGYVLFSKRVNVTLKHRIRREDLARVMSREKIGTIKFIRSQAKLPA